MTTPTPAPMQFRKKSQVIDAIQLGRSPLSLHTVLEFIGSSVPYAEHDEERDTHLIAIPTRDGGLMKVYVDDWVLRVDDEIRVCKPNVFAADYEPVSEVEACAASQPATPKFDRENPCQCGAYGGPESHAQWCKFAQPAEVQGLPELPSPSGHHFIGDDAEGTYTADQMREYALACLAARPAAGLPPGFVAVPLEPTEEMIDDALDCHDAGLAPESEVVAMYRAMLAAVGHKHG